MMKKHMSVSQFLKIIVSPQAYLNFLYLVATFPLGILYFVFLISGLSIGLSLVIVWIGIPILILVAASWWVLGKFEYSLTNHVLKEKLHPIYLPSQENSNLWTRFKIYFENPFTWKSLIYLMMKFPLGLATFTIMIVLVSLTVALVGMPAIYSGGLDISIYLGHALPVWQVDNFLKALFCSLIGLFLWPVTLHTLNGLAWLHAKLARLLLNSQPFGNPAEIF
jgi:hypothetical protein